MRRRVFVTVCGPYCGQTLACFFKVAFPFINTCHTKHGVTVAVNAITTFPFCGLDIHNNRVRSLYSMAQV
jgi:hypothetical protein